MLSVLYEIGVVLILYALHMRKVGVYLNLYGVYKIEVKIYVVYLREVKFIWGIYEKGNPYPM